MFCFFLNVLIYSVYSKFAVFIRRLYSIPTSVLTRGPPSEFQQLPISLVGRKSSQGVGLTVNELDDTIYFSPLTETSISSWNPVTNDQR